MYKKILKELVEIPGIPAHEHKVRDYILNKLKGSRAELTVTNLGCIVARFKGSSSEPAVMLDAHMDEVGYVVQYIENSGFLKITNYEFQYNGNRECVHRSIRHHRHFGFYSNYSEFTEKRRKTSSV